MSETLADADIVRRMKDYFARQMAWFEQLHDALAKLEGPVDPERLDGLLEADSARARKSKALEEEFSALKSEWDRAEAIPESAVNEVREIAGRAEKLASELQVAFDKAAQCTGAGVEALRERLGELKTKGQWLGKYRAEPPENAGLIDRQA